MQVIIKHGMPLIQTKDILRLPSVKNGADDLFCSILTQELEEFGFFSFLLNLSHLKACTGLNSEKHHEFFFVPKDLVVSHYLAFREKRGLEFMRRSVLDTEVAEEILDQMEESIEKAVIKKQYTEDEIAYSECYMIIMVNGKYEVHQCIPFRVIEVLYNDTEYICDKCGKVHRGNTRFFEDYIPDIFYKKEEDRISYYCKDCIPKKGYSHLGDGRVYE